jgi:hypothetical protein
VRTPASQRQSWFMGPPGAARPVSVRCRAPARCIRATVAVLLAMRGGPGRPWANRPHSACFSPSECGLRVREVAPSGGGPDACLPRSIPRPGTPPEVLCHRDQRQATGSVGRQYQTPSRPGPGISGSGPSPGASSHLRSPLISLSSRRQGWAGVVWQPLMWLRAPGKSANPDIRNLQHI